MTPDDVDRRLDPEQLATFSRLTSPYEIQAYLDAIAYSSEPRNRSSLNVLRDRVGHCLDGSLFGVVALRRLGHPPVIVQLLPEPGADDDHILAVFKRGNFFGALAKSNFVGLRYREPVYRTVRELVMSYFDCYFNVDGQKTLRAYTRPLNLTSLDRFDWMWTDDGVDAVEEYLPRLRPIPLIDSEQTAALSPVHELTYRGHMVGVNEAGLFGRRIEPEGLGHRTA